MHSSSGPNAPIGFFLLVGVALISTIWLYFRYTRLRAPKAMIAWLLATLAGAAYGLYRFSKLDQIRTHGGFHTGMDRGDVGFYSIGSGLLVIVATAFGIRLYRKWLDGDLTEDERAGGTRGLRAWLSPANLFVAAAISFLGWSCVGLPLVLMLVATIGALVAWPALLADNRTNQNLRTDMPDHNTSREREKVLSLLESGKITAEESAELLQALSAASPDHQPLPPANSRSVLGIVGAVLVLVGFFLPWFSFSPTEKAASLMHEIDQSMGVNMTGAPMLEMSKMMPSMNVKIRGGDVGNGLGWIVLVLALGSAMLPHVAPSLDRSSLRAFRFVSLLAGGIILLYLFSQDIASVSIGLLLAVIGYACSAVALWREERPPVIGGDSAEARI